MSNILESRIREIEHRLEKLENRIEGHTDEEIIGILYREVGKGTTRLVGRSLLYLVGAVIAAIIAWVVAFFSLKGHS